MKKIVLSSLLLGTLACAQENIQEVEEKIAAIESQKASLDAELATLQAQLPKKEETPKSFVTRTELGYIQTKGNSDTETFSLDAKAKKQWEANSLALSLDAQYAKDRDVTTKNRYTAELNYGYDFSERFTLGYLVGYKDDKFSGYDYQAYTGPEVKYKAYASDIQTLSTEAAALYAQDKIEDADTERYASYRLKAVYDLLIMENLKFYQDATYRGSFEESDNYFITAKSALTAKINSTLSAGMSYKVDYANIAPEGSVRTDKTFTLNLIIDY